VVMGVGYNPRIVTDGLVLCLDAANKRSYPGSGTTWTDRSSNGYTGTLANGPTFDGNNGGRFYFDGSNDYCEFPETDVLNFQPTQPFSVFCWVIKNGIAGAVLANMNSSSPHQGWDIWHESSYTKFAMHLISSWSANAIKIQVNCNPYPDIQYFGYTYDGSCPVNTTDTLNSVNFFIDGELTTSGKVIASNADGFYSTSESISYPAGQKFRIGSRYTLQHGSSNLFAVHIYNKALSAQEILQNYEATKGRYA
jgi:hypothetical protein